FAGGGHEAWIGVIIVVQNVVSSLLNSHLFDFHEGWMYVLGVGVAGGLSLRAAVRPLRSLRSRGPLDPLPALTYQATSAVSPTLSPAGAIERRDNSARNFSKGRGGATR